MRYYAAIAWSFLFMLAATAGVCSAADIPESTSLVVDQAAVLTEEQRQALIGRLTAIQQSGRAQIAVLIAKDTGGAPLSDYALRVAESWKIGRAGRDDGLLILIVPSPAGARLEVGYGLEGPIPDARASQWIDELLPAIRADRTATGLNHLLDEIDKALPAVEAKSQGFILDEHPEWKLPFVLIVFSPFAIFPLFFGRWGGIPSAFLFACFMGGAAWSLRGLHSGIVAAAAAFPLPLMWMLNHWDNAFLPAWLRWVKHFGNFFAVLIFFSVISLFVSGGLMMAGEMWWPGLFFSGLLSIGIAVFLFPGKPAQYLMVALRSLIHFVFVLVLAYIALQPFTPDPSRLAFLTAGLVTALIGTGLYLDSRNAKRWITLLFYSTAVLLALPFALLSLFLAVGGEDAQTQLVHLATGGGSLAAIVALAVRVGLIAAVKVGLGGLFGGGGAGRSD